MMRILFLVVLCLMCANCTPQKSQTNDTAGQKTSVAPAQSQASTTAPTSPDVTTTSAATTTIAVNAQVKKDNDPFIAEGKWMLSVYNPQTGVTEYYSANGVYLGMQKT